jgi:hypothetical protein
MAKGDGGGEHTLPVPGLAGSPPLTVVCIDLGVEEALAAYSERFQPRGGYSYTLVAGSERGYDARAVRTRLIEDLAGWLGSGSVALGPEGPLWGLRGRSS